MNKDLVDSSNDTLTSDEILENTTACQQILFFIGEKVELI
jgi:hypothetical protein